MQHSAAYAGTMTSTRLLQFRTKAWRPMRWLALIVLAATLVACSRTPPPAWRLTDISGHLPDLKFNLTDDNGKAVQASDYRGKVTLLYFGYTHCPDVCPLTLTHLHVVLQRLGAQADKVRILFVSVDPARDTPKVMHPYVTAFDKHIVGLSGDEKQIEQLAKRYRVGYSRGPVKADGSYDVNHSSAIYIFDADGHMRLMASPVSSNDDMVHDLTLLLATEH